MKKRIGLQGALFFIGALFCILFPKLIFPSWASKPFEELIDTLGMLCLLFGLLFRISARGYKAERSGQSSKLVKGGLYALVRNPMYLGSFLVGTGVTAVIFDIWIFLIFAGIYLFIYIKEISKEEKILTEAFGQEYTEYCKNTPRFFPHPKYLMHLNKFVIIKKGWAKKEINTLLGSLLLIFAVEIWQDYTLFPVEMWFEEFVELTFIIAAFLMFTNFFLLKDTTVPLNTDEPE